MICIGEERDLIKFMILDIVDLRFILSKKILWGCVSLKIVLICGYFRLYVF